MSRCSARHAASVIAWPFGQIMPTRSARKSAALVSTRYSASGSLRSMTVACEALRPSKRTTPPDSSGGVSVLQAVRTTTREMARIGLSPISGIRPGTRRTLPSRDLAVNPEDPGPEPEYDEPLPEDVVQRPPVRPLLLIALVSCARFTAGGQPVP